MPDIHYTLHNALRDYRNVDTAFWRKDTPGVHTSHKTKGMYVNATMDYLSSVGGVRYHDQLVCVNPFSKERNSEILVREVKKKLEFQLANFRKVFKIPESGGQPTLLYSGKIDGEGKVSSALNDDLAMALLINTYAEKAIRLGELKTQNGKPFKQL